MHAIIYCIKTNLLVEVKKIVFTLFTLALVCQSADAQFFKKLFKKKAKTEAKAPVAADGIDDDAQLALADIASCSDNRNNRNAFLNIPLGIKADRFEKLLLQQGFVERKNEGAQTSKMKGRSMVLSHSLHWLFRNKRGAFMLLMWKTRPSILRSRPSNNVLPA